MFLKKYVSYTFRDKKKDEFLTLEQGTISLVAYKANFHAFSRYALQLITSKVERFRYFLKGQNLRNQLATLFVVVIVKSFQDVVEFSKKVKELDK